jgi:hypothetical protein
MAENMMPPNGGSDAVLRTPRIIVAAMAGGVLMFVGVAAYLVELGEFPIKPELAGTLLPVLVIAAVGGLVGYVVVRSTMLKQPRPAGSGLAHPGKLGPYGMIVLIGGALAESVGLLGVVVYLVSGSRLALLAPAFSVLLILAQWPTSAGLERWTPRESDLVASRDSR